MTDKEQAENFPRLTEPPDVLVTLPENKFQLAKIRHELRTPINHIIGYSEILEEDVTEMGQLIFLDDLKRIQVAGRQLLDLVNEMFTVKEGESRQVDVRNSLPTLRTPINHVIGYAEILEEQAGEAGFGAIISDLQKIGSAGRTLLQMLENHLLHPAGAVEEIAEKAGTGRTRLIRREDLSLPMAERSDWKILVVDDDTENREMLSRRIVRMGCAVYSAENGKRALELLRSKAFDLVLLDLMMPEMDGAEVLQAIKSDEKLRHIPVIMLSAMDTMDSIVECIEGGAEDFIAKPFNPTFLKARITAVLEKKRMRDREQIYLQRIQQEQEKSEKLLLNVLPRAIANRLKNGETTIADSFPDVTVVFVDVVGFTSLSMHISAEEVVRLLDEIFSAFDLLAERWGLEKIKTIGDAYMAVAGLPSPRSDHIAAAAEFCLDILKEVERFNRGYHTSINLRIGVNSGPVTAGIIGRNKFIYDLWGDTVNTASRMESHGIPGHIQVSQAVYAALHHDFSFHDRGEIEVKGKGKMATYFLTGRKTPRPASA